MAATLSALLPLTVAGAAPDARKTRVTLLASGLQGAGGSTVGPGDALYVVEGAAGRITRIDPRTGRASTFASGLPPAIIGIGGAIDVAFVGETAYVLVTLVGPDVGGQDVVGIYRVDGPTQVSVVADLGAFSVAHPPNTSYFIPTGVQYALEPYEGGFLVTDGHHNRVLRVTGEGEVSEWIAFGNLVPTGLAATRDSVYVAQAGPVPHLPADGKVIRVKRKSRKSREAAAGARLLVDVEIGRGGRLYALSQGYFPPGTAEGSPAQPYTGSLVRARSNGTFAVVADRLNQPTSLEFIGRSAYIVSLAGDVWKIEGVTDRVETEDRDDRGASVAPQGPW
jgi:sugar lactone lactonase YvrE